MSDLALDVTKVQVLSLVRLGYGPMQITPASMPAKRHCDIARRSSAYSLRSAGLHLSSEGVLN